MDHERPMSSLQITTSLVLGASLTRFALPPTAHPGPADGGRPRGAASHHRLAAADVPAGNHHRWVNAALIGDERPS